MQEKEILDCRLHQYFSVLLSNRGEEYENIEEDATCQHAAQAEIREPTLEEVNEILQSLKNYRTPDNESARPELLNSGVKHS